MTFLKGQNFKTVLLFCYKEIVVK